MDNNANFGSYSNDCWFQALTANGDTSNQATISSQEYPYCPSQQSGSHLFHYARYFVPWDAISYSNSGITQNPNCTPSPLWQNGTGADWTNLKNAIAEGEHDGLTPMVVISGGPGGPAQSGLNQTPSDNDYYCGMTALMGSLTYAGLHVGAWEIYNEPDDSPSDGGFGTTSGNKWGDNCGTNDCLINAAADLYLDAYYARANANKQDQSDKLIVGSFNYGSVGHSDPTDYMNTYLSRIATLVQDGYRTPDAVSGHPYDDVSAAVGNGGNDGTTRNLLYATNTYLPGTPIWLTETGDWLDDPNWPQSDGDPSAQQRAGISFLSLAGVDSAQIQYVFWYEYQAPADNHFDSALVDHNGNGRQSYCQLYGNPGGCTGGNPKDARRALSPRAYPCRWRMLSDG